MVGVANQKAIVILTRAPASGGKTRLFAQLGSFPDVDLLTSLLIDTIDGLADVDARLVVAVTPADACGGVERLLRRELGARAAAIDVTVQPEGALGDRMRGMMERMLADGVTAVAIVGSDVPGITAEQVRGAFEWLERDPEALVLGPAADGGYYLIAATRVPPVFEAIAWGTDQVFADTSRTAEACGLRVRVVEVLRDIDSVEDLLACADDVPTSRTAAWVRRHRGPAGWTR